MNIREIVEATIRKYNTRLPYELADLMDMKIEANKFAVELLIPNEVILENWWYTTDRLARWTGYSEELIKLRLKWQEEEQSMGKITQLCDALGEKEIVKLPRTALYDRGDYIMSLNGHGMEPDFPDGSVVVVSQTEKVVIGDVSIFIINDKTLIKELGENELICRNKAYPNIPINESDNIVCVGKVIRLCDKKDIISEVTP